VIVVDLYELLQVHPRAEAEVIRAAFRALARKHHPDAGGDARKMMALTDAWRILGDRRARARYDAARAVQLAMAANAAASAPAPAGAAMRPAPAPTAPVTAAPSYQPADIGVFNAPPHTSADGTVLDFGRYAGWSIRELALRDPDYLEWLKRTSIGRRLTSEIELDLAALDTKAPAPMRPPQSSRFRRPIFGRA
jgi:curved DNA-binding protein CbpA